MRYYCNPRPPHDQFSTLTSLSDNIFNLLSEETVYLQAKATIKFCRLVGIKVDTALIDTPDKNYPDSKVIKIIFKSEHPVSSMLHGYGLNHTGDCYLYFPFCDINYACNAYIHWSMIWGRGPLTDVSHSLHQERAERGLGMRRMIHLHHVGQLITNTLPGQLAVRDHEARDDSE